jgi:hypothetical protein
MNIGRRSVVRIVMANCARVYHDLPLGPGGGMKQSESTVYADVLVELAAIV